MTLTDCGAEPRRKIPRLAADLSNCLLQHACRKPPPSGVGGGHCGTVTGREENWNAICNLDHAHTIVTAGDRGIGCPLAPIFIEIRHLSAVHLLQPGRLGGQSQVLPQSAPILSDGFRDVANVYADIERSIWASADSRAAQCERRVHPRWQ